MTDTLLPPVIGVAESHTSDHAQCGSLAAQAILRIVLPNAIMPTLDNSNAYEIAAAITKISPLIKATPVIENLADVVAVNLPLGRYVLGIVYCTPDAVPTTAASHSATHWVAIYEPNGAYYQCWSATLQPGGWDMRDDWYAGNANLVIDLSEVLALDPELVVKINQIWAAIFGPTASNGGIPGSAAPGNNIDIIRRKLSGYAAGYPAASGAEIGATLGTGLTAAQAAAVAEIPTVLATLQRIEAALKGA